MKGQLDLGQRDAISLSHHQKFIWTRFATIFLGIWLLITPATFDYASTVLGVNDWISGLLLIFFGTISLSYRFKAFIWGGCIVGLWLQFAPLAFWASNPVIYLNETLIGVLAMGLCLLVPLRPHEFEVGPSIPPGWSYNPSAWPQRLPIIFFAMVGWFLARYMASFQLHYIHTIWDPFFGLGTEKVITSIISQEFPVSDAGLGALAYSLETILGAKGGTRRWHTMPWLVVFFGILVVPVGFVSIVLIMLQPIAVGAWCGICLIIAACMLFMLALAVDEVIAVFQFLKRSHKEGKPLWHTFWHGSNYPLDYPEDDDARTPSFHNSALKIFQSMRWGVTLPWNLVLTTLLGIWLLFSDNIFGFQGFAANNIEVCAALITAISIISFAEVIRAIRLFNVIISLWLIIGTFILPGTSESMMWHYVIIAVIIMVLSLFKGKIKENYGEWNSAIF